VPTGSSITTFTNLFSVTSAGTSSATIGQWFGAIANFGTTGPATSVAAIQTAEASGTCPLPSTSFPAGATLNLCSAVGSGGGGSWTFVNSVVTAIFCVMMGLALFHLVRRAITGNSA
jgi:hypothetical protein